MRIIKLITIFSLVLISIFTACKKDVIVKDITKETVNTLSPPDNYNTPNNNITFWWDKVDGADKYNVQIVSPSFSSIQQLIADTNITGDKYVKTLTPGTYQWRIRATNGGGNTAWTVRTLTIDTSSNLAYAGVILISPVDSFYTRSLTHTLSWYPVNNATVYELNVTGSPSANYSTTSATITLPSTQGAYTWKVRAENAFSFSPYTARVIILDQTAPAPPGLISPASGTTVKVDSMLIWSIPNTTDSYKDFVLVSDTSSFSNIVKYDSVSTSTALVRSYSLTNIVPALVSGKTYYWKVKSADRAGNVGVYGTSRSFKIQ